MELFNFLTVAFVQSLATFYRKVRKKEICQTDISKLRTSKEIIYSILPFLIILITSFQTAKFNKKNLFLNLLKKDKPVIVILLHIVIHLK